MREFEINYLVIGLYFIKFLQFYITNVMSLCPADASLINPKAHFM